MKSRALDNDQQLVEEIKQGGSACERAMKHLYRQHLDSVVNFIVNRNGSREEAKDVFQDAVVNVLVAVQKGKFSGESSLGTYLFAISKNLWYRRFKRSLKQGEMPEDHQEKASEAPEPDTVLMGSEEQQLVQGLLDQLKAKCLEVLTFWAQKYAMKEIAERLGYQNDQVVRNKKNHCLKELRKLVAQHPEARALVKELVG
ncbi:MAG: sigma-70 family RNA polymerase sigma factor [Bacteroidota bacterium]